MSSPSKLESAHQAAMLEIIATAAEETAERHRLIGNKEIGIESVTAFALQDAFEMFGRELRAMNPS